MKDKKSLLIFVAIIGAVLILAILLTQPDPPEVVDYGTLMNKITNDEVAGIILVDNYNVNILYKDSVITLEEFKKGKVFDATCIVTDRTSFALAIDEI